MDQENKEIHCFMTGNGCSKLKISDHGSKDNKKVFALIPFREPYFDYDKFAIKDFFISKHFECSYGGEYAYIDGEYIICKICEEIYKSSIIVADISDKNPNVYYELGIAHGLGKSTIVTVNNYITSGSDKEVFPFINRKCDMIYYDGIHRLKSELSVDAKDFPIPKNQGKNIFYICLIPKESGNERKIEKYAEVYNYGIKDAIHKLEFPADELSGLNTEEVYNIIDEAREPDEYAVKKNIDKISQARYCIIDITEKEHQEVFYWLGFIHGLRVNPDIKLRSDLVCLYITKGRMKELPFDIRAARIIYYNSIEDLNVKIKKEIEQLEVARITAYNKEKEKFWKNFNVKNTLFLVGASDSYPVGEETETRNRISIQDFKAYNRIIYQLLFVGPRQSFQYNLKELELSKFFSEKYKKSLVDIKNLKNNNNSGINEEELWKEMKIDKNQDKFKNILLSREQHFENKERCRFIENIVIIGSSCVNPAAENLMEMIYSRTEEKTIFKTSHRYKSRSEYWHYIPPSGKKIKDTEESGIYIINKTGDEKKVGERARCGCIKEKDFFLSRDTALLIICSGSFYCKTYNIFYNENANMIKGDIILMSGFGKYGTYQLSRMLSKINKPSNDEDNPIKIGSENMCISVEDLFLEVNNIKKEGTYCIEAVFDFIQDCHPNDKSSCTECACKKKADAPYRLKEMNSLSFNGSKAIERENLLKNVIAREKMKMKLSRNKLKECH